MIDKRYCWHSVEQGLPELYESVLCYTFEGDICIAHLVPYFGTPEWYCYDVKIERVTHWMLLPDGPYAMEDVE